MLLLTGAGPCSILHFVEAMIVFVIVESSCGVPMIDGAVGE